MSEQTAWFYHTPAWEQTREACMVRPVEMAFGICPPGMCERCFTHGELQPAEIVHHIKHVSPQNMYDPSVTLDMTNLMRVCRKCHGELHSGESFEPRVAFDADGNVVRRSNG